MNKLYKSSSDRLVFGVFGGLADFIDIDSTLIRLLAIILFLKSPINFLFIYLLAAIIIPDDIEVISNRPAQKSSRYGQRNLGIFITIVGIFLLIRNIFPNFHFQIMPQLRYLFNKLLKFWPILLILLGLSIIGKNQEKD